MFMRFAQRVSFVMSLALPRSAAPLRCAQRLRRCRAEMPPAAVRPESASARESAARVIVAFATQHVACYACFHAALCSIFAMRYVLC